jgi:biopolymer transport protein ExbB
VALASLFEAVQDFLERGGNVLYLIMGVTFFMWALILERQWYFRRVFPREAQGVLDIWRAREERASWYAQQVRRQLVSRVRQGLDHSLGMVKTL